MATPWTITEFDLSTIIFRQRESFRHKVLWTAVPIAVVFAVIAIMRNGTEWFGAVGPWIVGLVAFAFAALLIVGMIERAKERRGMQAAAEVTDVSSLADVLGSQLDGIGPLAGVNVRDVLEATSTMLSGPSSEQATSPEHRPDRRIVAGLIQIILWTIIAIVALATAGFAIYVALSSTESFHHPERVFKLIITGPAAIIAILLYLLARTRKKSADHLLEYDQRPPILYLRSFKDDRRKIRMARKNDDPVLVGFEDALSELFFRVGPFIALGSKKDFIPRLGAARTYRDDSVWQAKAKRWMQDATWVLYLLGSTESLKWEIAQITQDQLIEKTIFLFPPNVGASESRLEKQRLQAWNNFLEAFANTEFHGALTGFSQTGAIAMWIGPGRHIFVARANGEFSQEYDLAVRIALYLKRRTDVVSSQKASAEPVSADSNASTAAMEPSRVAGASAGVT